MELLVNDKKLVIIKGDITKQEVDVIVNAANNHLLHVGGVARAIANAAESELEKESNEIEFVPTGECVSTSAGNLKAKIVVHAVGPIWQDGNSKEPELLAACILNSLKLTDSHGFRTIAFPAISTGIYGYPIKKAAKILISIAKKYLEKHAQKISEIRFVLYSESDYSVFEQELKLL